MKIEEWLLILTMNNVLPLFPTPVITIDVEERTDELKPEDFEYNIIDHVGSDGGTRSYQSFNLRILSKYPRISKLLLKKFDKVKQLLHLNHQFVITTSWFTKTETGGYSLPHLHKNSFYSGVYYFDDYTDESGELELINPSMDKADFLLDAKEWNMYNSAGWTVEPKKNLLVFFPSYIRHCVKIHKDPITRYSLAFNVVPTGMYGVGDSVMNTSWLTS
tara:strand:+ start:2128 stop:2781 length:654 start_codon:yes stop_codon:yes gene_type:complete